MFRRKQRGRRKKGKEITAETAYQKMKELLQNLMKSGYKLTEIYGMTINDIELLAEISNTKVEEPEPELTTLDKAFPFLF